MTRERNHWITFVAHTVVGWVAVLPPPRGDAEAAIRFGARLVNAGKRHAVWDPEAFATAADFERRAWRAARERERIALLFRGTDGTAATPARLAFYRDDRIVEEMVTDVGALLRALRPGRPASTIRSTPPLVVTGASIAIEHDAEVRVEVRLDTDIWFPRVIGFAEPPGDGDDAAYDNRGLAERHTPRLNAFLAELAAEATAIGGRWETLEVSGVAASYAGEWDAAGIHL